MILEIVEKLIALLKAEEDLAGVTWHNGEPKGWDLADHGEGYVTLLPVEQQDVEPLMGTAERFKMYYLICLGYKHMDETTCDTWVYQKTEIIFSLLKANINLGGIVDESHLRGFQFFPSTDNDRTFDRMFIRLFVEKDSIS